MQGGDLAPSEERYLKDHTNFIFFFYYAASIVLIGRNKRENRNSVCLSIVNRRFFVSLGG
jgi:hypothetical protein